MHKSNNFWMGLIAVAAVASVGCGDSSSGAAGTGGAGGAGGSGGAEGVNVTAVHLAPEFPSAESSAVALFLDGAEIPGTLEYGQSTGRANVPAGTYDVGLGLPGADAPVLELQDVELADGDDITIVAYAIDADPGVDVFVFSNGTDGLAAGSGRVNVAHGANDAALDPVNIVTTDAMMPTSCTDLIPGFEFGTQVPAPDATEPLDVEADELLVAFDLDAECPPVTLGPVAVPVTDDVVSIVVAVDEDTGPGLDVELWAIVDASDSPIPLINAEPQ